MIDKKLLEKYEEPKNKRPNLNAVIDPEDKENLEKNARENNISVSKVVRIILKEFFEKKTTGDETEKKH